MHWTWNGHLHICWWFVLICFNYTIENSRYFVTNPLLQTLWFFHSNIALDLRPSIITEMISYSYIRSHASSNHINISIRANILKLRLLWPCGFMEWVEIWYVLVFFTWKSIITVTMNSKSMRHFTISIVSIGK